MKPSKTAILAGGAMLVLAGSAYAAAKAPMMHTMTVKTPDGGVATIQYSGNVAPTVRFGTAPTPSVFFGQNTPFVGFAHISAAMNREMDVLLHQADMLALPFANPLDNATAYGAPAAHSHAWFASLGGSGFCMQSVQVTQDANGKRHVVSHSSGNCGQAAGLTGTTAHAIPRNGDGMLEAVSKAPAQKKLPMFYEAGYKPR